MTGNETWKGRVREESGTNASKNVFVTLIFVSLITYLHFLFQDRAGDSNLILASKGGHKQIVDALVKRYADLDVKVLRVLCRS